MSDNATLQVPAVTKTSGAPVPRGAQNPAAPASAQSNPGLPGAQNHGAAPATLNETTVPAALSYAASLANLSYTTPLHALHTVMAPSAPHFATAPRPVHYAVKRQAVQLAWATRAVETGMATFKLMASGRALGSSLDLLRMQQAVFKQLNELGQEWLRGVAAWTEECTQLKAANTVSKIAEQEFDLIGQFTQLVTDQTTAVVNLMESAQVGYGFWVQQKLEG